MRICPNCAHAFEAASWHCPACDQEPLIIEGFPALAADMARGATEHGDNRIQHHDRHELQTLS